MPRAARAAAATEAGESSRRSLALDVASVGQRVWHQEVRAVEAHVDAASRTTRVVMEVQTRD